MPKKLNLTNQRFGRLVALEKLNKNNQGKYFWLFQCDCGKQTKVIPYDVTSGKTQSCGCYHIQCASEANFKHGYANKNDSTYKIWIGMHDRCNRVTHQDYKYYGGLGITYCIQWNEFENFLVDMGPRPSSNHTLDRINPFGNYEPDNCRWATQIEQVNNTRRQYEAKHRSELLETI